MQVVWVADLPSKVACMPLLEKGAPGTEVEVMAPFHMDSKESQSMEILPGTRGCVIHPAGFLDTDRLTSRPWAHEVAVVALAPPTAQARESTDRRLTCLFQAFRGTKSRFRRCSY